MELQADHEDAEGVDQAVSDLNALREELAHTKAKLKVEKNIASESEVASQRIVESLPGANFEEDSNHLAMLLATVMQHDDFEYNEETNKVEPKPYFDFLKRIEEHCNDKPDMEAKLITVRNKSLEKMERTVRRERRLSTSGSVSSVGSMRSASSKQNLRVDIFQSSADQPFQSPCSQVQLNFSHNGQRKRNFNNILHEYSWPE